MQHIMHSDLNGTERHVQVYLVFSDVGQCCHGLSNIF